MTRLKYDLINKLNNDKYLEEVELVRLYEQPINYKQKLEEIDAVLGNIALINIKLGLVEHYFREQPVETEQEKK